MAKNDFQYAGWNSYTLQCAGASILGGGVGEQSPTFLKVGGWRIGYFNYKYVALRSSDGYAKSGDKWYLRVYAKVTYFMDCC